MVLDNTRGWTLAASLTSVCSASATAWPISAMESGSRVARMVEISKTKTTDGSYAGLDGFER